MKASAELLQNVKLELESALDVNPIIHFISFLFDTILDIIDEEFQKIEKRYGESNEDLVQIDGIIDNVCKKIWPNFWWAAEDKIRIGLSAELKGEYGCFLGRFSKPVSLLSSKRYGAITNIENNKISS